MIRKACECGATLHMADRDGKTVQAALELWNSVHGEHEEVTCAEATRIRELGDGGMQQRRRAS